MVAGPADAETRLRRQHRSGESYRRTTCEDLQDSQRDEDSFEDKMSSRQKLGRDWGKREYVPNIRMSCQRR